jgi:hypothetical protein
MLWEDDNDLDGFISDYGESLRKAKDYNGQPRGDDGRFGKGKQTKKKVADYVPAGERTPKQGPLV